MKTLKTTFAILCIALLSISCSPEDGIDGTNGTNGTNGVPVYYNPITITGGLNNGSVNVSTTWTILNIGTKTFNKIDANTHIDLKFRSNILSGVFSTSPAAIEYEMLVDGNAGFSSSNFITYTSNKTEYVILDSTFTNLLAGSHTITIRAKMNNGTSTYVLVDAGNYGGKIIVQER